MRGKIANRNSLSIIRRRLWAAILSALLLIAGATASAEKAQANSVVGNVTVQDKNGNSLEDHSGVVVFIEGVEQSLRPDTSLVPPKVSHAGSRYSPRVLAIQKGSIVDFFNDDAVYHNVFSLSKAKTFDLGIYAQGTSKLVSFDKSGLIKIYCNIHPNMISTILVLENGYFAVTNSAGEYQIDALPDGDFTLRVWSELSDEISHEISVRGGEVYSKDYSVRQTKKFTKHKNKFGRPYRDKY